MTLDVQLVGTTTKMAIVNLRPGQVVYSEAGKFLFCSGDVAMETKMSAPSSPGAQPNGGGQVGGSGALGGLLRGAMDAGKRVLAGESFAFTHFSTRGGDGLLALAGVLPGEMRAIELDGRTTWFAEKDAFVAAEAGVNFDIAFSGLRSGFSGGEGFVLEKFTGVGTLLIGGAGDFIDINPADYGGKLRVDTGCIVAWDQNIRYGVERVGRLNKQGVMNAMFGGEGFSLATVEGNGRVILQSVTIDGLAKALEKNAGAGDKKTGAGLGGIFSGSAD
ncbi:AIM24 family protein [Blastococcus sp. CT_GayMR16]|uniref:AIM24 family protein n=1 Tax=Blastococcus sp. CT_GayMR16 TaxID=2559607 RepID=UPI0010740289|nr:AIM24 family protein [Blastococcus sp. CT_GayMR16]TFV87395.1 AIM24 family protein [Blastococcus sp. CT_GayMR16]